MARLKGLGSSCVNDNLKRDIEELNLEIDSKNSNISKLQDSEILKDREIKELRDQLDKLHLCLLKPEILVDFAAIQHQYWYSQVLLPQLFFI